MRPLEVKEREIERAEGRNGSRHTHLNLISVSNETFSFSSIWLEDLGCETNAGIAHPFFRLAHITKSYWYGLFFSLWFKMGAHAGANKKKNKKPHWDDGGKKSFLHHLRHGFHLARDKIDEVG